MKTAFVTGATGCVGRNLINELLRDQWKVIAMHRRSSDVSRLAGLSVELKETDIHDLDSVRKSIPDGVDAVFHAAANVSHWPLEEKEQWKDNVLGTRHLVQAALEKKAKRFIFTSTGATFKFSHTSKSEAARIGCSYVRTKRLAELEVQDGIARGLDAVITRPIIVVGAFDYGNYSQIFTHMKAGKVAVFPGSIEFCHARDVARAHISAFEKGRKGECSVLAGPEATWLEFCQKIARLLDVPPPKKQTPPAWALYALSYLLLWISYLTRKKPLITPQLLDLVVKVGGVFSAEESRKSRQELGYQSASLDEMLKDCHEWMVREGRL